MITAERKPIQEIIDFVSPFKKVLLVGCNECVTVCSAGGRKKVAILSSALQVALMKAGKIIHIQEVTLERQCDPEYVEQAPLRKSTPSMPCCPWHAGAGCRRSPGVTRKTGLPRGQHQVHGRVGTPRRLG